MRKVWRNALLAAATAAMLSSPASAYRRMVEAVDGDTLTLTGSGPLSGFKVRIEGLDAPEMRGRCQYESDLAYRAKARLAALVYPGVTFVTDFQADRYGRLLARVFDRQNVDVAETLIKEGLARRYDGRTARQPWCPTSDAAG